MSEWWCSSLQHCQHSMTALKVSSDALISVTCVWLCFIMFLNCNTSTPFKSLKVGSHSVHTSLHRAAQCILH